MTGFKISAFQDDGVGAFGNTGDRTSHNAGEADNTAFVADDDVIGC